MEPLNSQQFESFIVAKRAAAVHFDAEWNGSYRAFMRRQMREAEASLREKVNFGEVDCDASPELAKSIPILNLPSVAYYAGGKDCSAHRGRTGCPCPRRANFAR